MNRPIILGGGVAGIAAAAELADAGSEPILIESRPYLGGRVRSFRHAETGDEIDNGQHLLMGCYHQTLRLLERLGTRRLVELQPTLRVQFRKADGSVHFLSAPSSLPSPLNVAVAMLRFDPLSLIERIGLLRAGVSAMTRTPSAEEKVESWLNRLRQSSNARQWLWDPIILATLNTAPEEASAKLLAQVMRLGFMGKGDDSKLAIPRAGLSSLLAPAQDFIAERGGTVLTGQPVRRVERVEGGKGGWRVQLRNGDRLETSALISALPWRSFRSLFAHHLPELPAIVHPIKHNPIISLYLWFDQPPEEIPEFCAMIGTRVQWVFNRRKTVAEPNREFPGLLSCVISAADTLTSDDDEDMVAMAEEELRSAFSSLRKIRLRTSLVIREKHATFAATPESDQLRPPPGELSPGLFLAGDWTATGLPGTIEGGIQSGVTAAHSVRKRA